MSNDSLESKKLTLLRTLEILERYSDEDHHLTQQDIIHYLERDYGLVLERKAVARDLSRLKEAGVEIESDRKGSYLAVRKFDDTELRILIDGVLSSPFISGRDSDDLIKRLCSMSSVYFPVKNKHIYTVGEWDKEENPQLLYNIDLISQAIDQKKQMEVTFTHFEEDKKRHKSPFPFHVTPVAIFLIEQEYLFLFIWDLNQGDKEEGVDPMLWAVPLRDLTNLKLLEDEKAIPIKTMDVFRDGVSIPKFVKEYGIGKEGGVFSQESAKRLLITFACPSTKIGRAIDYFGKNISIAKIPELDENLISGDSPWALLWKDGKNYKSMVKITVYTTARTAVNFVFEEYPFIVILSPESVKKQMKEEIAEFTKINTKLSKALGNQ